MTTPTTIQIDLKKWKDPKVWIVIGAIFGVTNLTELADLARKSLFRGGDIEKAVAAEAQARQAADSAILVRLDTMGRQMQGVVGSVGRMERGLKVTQDYLLQVPQVKVYDKARAKADSLRRERDRIRREAFERDARGPWHTDRELR